VQGERKQVTVLFADVVGSMTLAAGMDPEEWGELDRALAITEAFGLRPFTAQVHRVQADVALALGDEATYRRKLDEAHRLFLEVGATGRAAEVASLLGPLMQVLPPGSASPARSAAPGRPGT